MYLFDGHYYSVTIPRNDFGVKGQDFKRGNVCTSCRVQMLAHYGLETSSYIGYLEINKEIGIAL